MTVSAVTGGAALDALGWALVHFLWQGALVAGLYACFSALAPRAGAQARYLAACAALALMLAFPVATFFLKLGHAPSRPAAESAAIGDGRFDSARTRARAEAGGEISPPSHARETQVGGRDEGVSLREWAAARVGALAPWLAVLWALGVCGMGLRTGMGWLAVRRLRASARSAAGPCQQIFARLVTRLRVSEAARLCQSALVEVPTVVGLLRPVVLVPASAFTGLTPRQLEAVLAHELAHVRRYDCLVNLLQTAVETLLFYHPAVWWVSARARAEREHACDDAAVEATGDALLYARALTTLETLRRAGARPSPALALAADGGSLMRRIQRLVQPSAGKTSTRSPLAAGALLLALVCGAALASRALAPAEASGTMLTPAGASASAPPRREVAVTFVSFPGNMIYDDGRLTNKTRKLMRGLAKHDIKAVGFVNSGRLFKDDGSNDEARIRMLGEWLDAGHELGNETAHHRSLYRAGLEEFKAEVIEGEKVIDKLVRERGGRLRYFSYPYLNTGPNAEAKAAAERFLRERGYQIHPVTVDNMDWLFNRAYLEALRREDDAAAEAIRAEYVPYMERMFEFFEEYSREVVGREFPQILMLTGGALNADAFDDLAAMLKRRGYSFVTMEQALKDDAYKLPDTYTGERGDSWIARWAVSKGMEYKDSEENLPPLMEQYFADYRKKMAEEKAGKK